ncbi:hypothetical protein BJ878DRAFT_537464 [Calycina marina]|uniref:Uncharacterized protein n=1 Tax=Calycina marina TaxID=1763456 RepID=A0A9P8CL44_9HELO|nr:hypothetical protein BJ878DRAFT_537464 [Calycina marina]
MYAPSYNPYGGPGNAGSQPYKPPNSGSGGQGGQPQSQSQATHPSQQPGVVQQQPQQMMYNPQSHSQPQPQAVYSAVQPTSYGVNPGMAGNLSGMAMMQNPGLAQMSPGQVAGGQYQTPYTTSPYGTSIPTSSSSNLPQNHLPTSSAASNFQMNPSHMNMQPNHMQPPAQTSTPNARASPYAGIHQSTPPNVIAQSQFSTPQNMAQQAAVVAPQTPSFPLGNGAQVAGGGGGNTAPPMSPGSETREKERVSLLLDINIMLLLEASRVQEIASAEKKDTAEGQPAVVTPEIKAAKADYVACMQRLQSNLAYLAAIADRSHKPISTIHPHPQIMLAPNLSTAVKAETDAEPDVKANEKKDLLNQQYARLLELFPEAGVTKERTAAAKQSRKSESTAEEYTVVRASHTQPARN